MDDALIVVAIIGLIALVGVIRYAINAGANKAARAAKNAYARKKNAEATDQPQSLADRYQKKD